MSKTPKQQLREDIKNIIVDNPAQPMLTNVKIMSLIDHYVDILVGKDEIEWETVPCECGHGTKRTPIGGYTASAIARDRFRQEIRKVAGL